MKRIGLWFSGPVFVSLVLAFLVGALFIRIAGVDPIAGYTAMFEGALSNGRGIADTLQLGVPIIGMAIAIGIAFRAGIINLGAEGQMVLGGLSGGLVALTMDGPAFLVTLAAIVTAIAVGALWAMLCAGMYAWLGVPILITTLLLNYPARYFASWLVRFPLKDPTSSMVASRPIDPDIQISMIAPPGSGFAAFLRNNLGSDSIITMVLTNTNWSLVFVAIIVGLTVFMNRRTIFGFESGINGQNPLFARYSGVKSNAMTTKTLALSGGISGLIGVCLTIGAPTTRIIENSLVNTNYAWTGLLVALLALYRPMPTVLAGLFFAAIMVGSNAMGRNFGMSPQISSVIQAIVIIFIAFRVQLPFVKRPHDVTTSPDADPPDEPDPLPPDIADPTAAAAEGEPVVVTPHGDVVSDVAPSPDRKVSDV